MSRAATWKRLGTLGTAAVLAAAGCRTSPVVRVSGVPVSVHATSQGPIEIPSAPLTKLEPDYATLPLLDPATADVTGVTRPPPVGVTEATCAKLAADHALLAAALEQENEVPTATVEVPGSSPAGGCSDSLLRELRPLLAGHLRNQAAGEAVAAFYQLADAEGRADVVRKTIESLDKLQAAVREAKAKGVKPPIDEEELDRQKGTWIGLLGQAELGAKLLDLELKRRLGASGRAAERLLPSGEFGLSAEPIDAAAAVKTALERRQDLLALRTAYLKLTPDNVGELREFLRTLPGGLGGAGFGPRVPVVSRMTEKKRAEVEAALATVAAMEVEVRKKQLFTLVEEKERAVADEVRAQVAVLTEQARQVGLARWRAEKLMAKLAELRKKEGGAAEIVPVELEANRARADVIQAVMAWHQARAKLAAAQGLYTGNGK